MGFLAYWFKTTAPRGGERVYIADNLGTVSSTSEYCKIGADEGWLTYESYFEDSYGTVHHTYRLTGGQAKTTHNHSPPKAKSKPKKRPRHIGHWE